MRLLYLQGLPLSGFPYLGRGTAPNLLWKAQPKGVGSGLSTDISPATG